jgi:putative membrane protein
MRKRTITQIIVIFTLLLVPALYALIFLGAYWNPTGKMSNIPVAVVNCDQGFMVNGENQNIGQELTGSLKSNKSVKWVFTNKDDADDGVLSQKYYAELIVPEDFTEKISSAGSKTKTQGILYFTSNDKNGMMASSLLSTVSSNLEANISNQISKNIVDTLTSKLQGLPSSMQTLSDGLTQLDDGSKQLKEGISTLAKGQSAFNNGLDKLATGLNDAKEGGSTLKDTLEKLSAKSILFKTGVNSSVTGTQTLSAYSAQYKDGLSKLTSNLDQYLDTSSEQLLNTIHIVSFFKQYIDAHPECISDKNIQAIITALNTSNKDNTESINPAVVSATLSKALNNLEVMYTKLNSQIIQLPNKMQTAADSSAALSQALSKVSNGSSSLSSGLKSAAQGAATLNQKSKSILKGDNKIYDGITQLNSAIELINNSVNDSILQLADNASTMQGLGQYIAEPVKIENVKIGEAENTGTALTPFMVSLCLYIGGFMIMITIFSMDSIKFKELPITQKLQFDLGLFRYQLIGIVQAILIALVVQNILGLNVQNTAQYYGICILGSLAFTTFIQLFVMLFDSLGKLLCLLFMMCQLTAGGGVLPTEILPAFYKTIHPYMPMTYTIGALRNVILSIDPKSYHYNVIVLMAIAAVTSLFVTLISFITHRREVMRNKQTQVLEV